MDIITRLNSMTKKQTQRLYASLKILRRYNKVNYNKLRNLEQSQLQALIDNEQLELTRHCDNCKYRKRKCSFLDDTVFRKTELKEIAEECELFESEE